MTVEKAHEFSSHHRGDILASKDCGCFYCINIFPPSEITEWIDCKESAICPYCGIDSVVGSASGIPITKEFLKEMYQFWFSIAAKTGSDNE